MIKDNLNNNCALLVDMSLQVSQDYLAYTFKKDLLFACFFCLPGLQRSRRNRFLDKSCRRDLRLDTFELKQTKNFRCIFKATQVREGIKKY